MIRKIIIVLPFLLLASLDMYAAAGSGMLTMRDSLYKAYNDLYPHFSTVAGGMGLIAGFGSLVYVFVRAYKMLMLAEPFDVYPILKPFGMGLLLIFYPGFLSLINGVGSIPVNFTNALVGETNETIEVLLNRKLQETSAWKWYNSNDMWGSYGAWVEDNDIDTGVIGEKHITAFAQFAGEQMKFQVKTYAREILFMILSVFYYGCSLLIDVARIFFLLVLGFLGPVAIALSMFDIFSGSLMGWLTRYAHVHLWLPVANIYGFLINSIQINLIQESIVQIETDGTSVFDGTDMAMLAFLFFAALGYFTIPSVSSWIVSPGAGGMGRAMNSVNALPNAASAATGAVVGVGVASAVGAKIAAGSSAAGGGGGAVAAAASAGNSNNHHQYNQLTS
jgi:conjugative transposon TraJ protein